MSKTKLIRSRNADFTGWTAVRRCRSSMALNAAACVVFARKYDHVTLLLYELH